MARDEQMRKAVALCVVAAWALLVGMSFADTIEDARKASAREDHTADQAVQQALSTPAVKPVSLSPAVLKPHPMFKASGYAPIDAPRIIQSAASRPLAFTWHDPPLAHRFRLFQFLSAYRL